MKNKPLKLALVGHGKMGKLVEELALKRGHSVPLIIDSSSSFIHFTPCDVIIDFSTPEQVLRTAKQAAIEKKNLVIGTTGWQNDLVEVKALAEKYQMGILYAPNFSIGVHLFLQVVKEACRLMEPTSLYDVAGLEIHHRQKGDAPSGTARALADTILKNWASKSAVLYEKPQEKIEKESLHFGSIRVGHEPGTHSIFFDSLNDTITLTHQVRGREGFAEGALLAAEWLFGRKGFYSLEDVFT